MEHRNDQWPRLQICLTRRLSYNLSTVGSLSWCTVSMCWQGWPTRRFCTRWSTAIGCRVHPAARAPSTRSCWSAGPRTRWSGQRLRRCSGSSRSSLCCPRANIASQRWPCDDCDPRCMLQSDPTAPTLSSNFVRYRPIWVVSTVSRRWLYDDIHMRTHTHANLCSAKNHSENESEALSLCSLICCISDGVPPVLFFCQIIKYTHVDCLQQILSMLDCIGWSYLIMYRERGFFWSAVWIL